MMNTVRKSESRLYITSSPFLCLGFLPDFHYLYLIYAARDYRNERKDAKDYRLLCNRK